MARHCNRARVRSSIGIKLKSITESEAWDLIKNGHADRLTSNRELAQGKPLEILMKPRRQSCRVRASITCGDIISNAEARDERRCNPATVKVDMWPHQHDRFAVTIHAGKVWIPNPRAAAERAAELAKP